MDRSSLALTGALVILCAMAIGYAYYRSYLWNDYVIEYQIACDPHNSTCYTMCDEDGACSYYQVMRKNASDLRRECGNSVEECDASFSCLPTDAYCEAVACTEDSALGITCTNSP